MKIQRKWRRAWLRDPWHFSRRRFSKKVVAKPARTVSRIARLKKKVLSPLAASLVIASLTTSAYANPTGGQVVGGSGSIAQTGNTMTVTQTTDKMSINWQDFSIGAKEKVVFQQPGAQSIALNRVLGNNASNIYGQLSANGQVFLINPNGVLFAKGSQVSVGGLAASTLNLSDKNFMAGNYTFSGAGGSVVNQGTISAEGGYVALMGSQVSNQGVIAAKQGTVALAAGKAVTLDLAGDGLVSLAVNEAAVNALAENKNLIQADGGTVLMSAKAAGTLVGTVVNNGGIIQAKSIGKVNGQIVLDGGNNGSVTVSGTLDASGKNAGETGGSIKVLGSDIKVASAALDASGDQGGGTVLIGGNREGQGSEIHAQNTTIAKDVSIKADALTKGNGGTVVVFADGTTNFDGSISAKGGSQSGSGGSVETSGHTLTVDGAAKVDTTAAKGSTGNWLLDPYDFTIDATGASGMKAADLTAALQSSSITIQTASTAGADAGDINVNAAVNWSANTLKLSAYNSIYINAALNATGTAGLALEYGQKASAAGNTSSYYVSAPINLASTASFSTKLGSNGTTSTYTILSSISDLAQMNNSSGYYALGTNLDFSSQGTLTSAVIGYFTGTFAGLGHTISNLKITSGNSRVGLFGTAQAIIRDVGLVGETITGTGNGSYIGGLVGYNQSGTIADCYATGVVSGTITADYIYKGGLVGYNNHGAITNCYTTGAVSGTSSGYDVYTGGLVGDNDHGTITNCYTTGVISVTSKGWNVYTGGLVGDNDQGNITNCYATGAVSDTGTATGYPLGTALVNVGGLVGENAGMITASYAEGMVSGAGSRAGGLVAYNFYGAIKNCYATGDVSSTNGGAMLNGSIVFLTQLGGLVGDNRATITNCYATGKVSADQVVWYGINIGGFVGSNYQGSISNCYWDADTSTQVNGVGYAVGSGATALYSSTNGSSAFSKSSYGTWFDDSTVWYMIDGYTRPFLRSEYSTTISNAHQLQLMSMNLGASYTLGGSIDMSELTKASGMWRTSATKDNSGNYGFVPVGTDSSNSFTGNFDGNGHTISKLTIYTGNDYVGLFGYSAGTIRGVGLVGDAITGTGAGSYFVGALVGLNDGTITDCYATGTVLGTSTGGTIQAGGLVGKNNSAITDCYVTGTVSGTSTGGTIQVGGLVGENAGMITASYAAGTVSGTGGTIQVGGLLGDNSSSISDCAWDTTHNTTPVANAIGSGAGTNIQTLDAAGMTTAANFTGWTDFSSHWRIYDGHSYPLLKAFLTPLTVSADSAVKTYDGTAYTALPTNISYAATNGVAVDMSKVLGTAVYGSGSEKNAGTYAATGLYSVQQGYDISYTSTSALTINPAVLSLSGYSGSRTYGDDNSSITYTGTLGGTVYGSDQVAIGGSVDSSITNRSNAGSYSGVLTAALTGSDAGNYVVTGTPVIGDLTINKALLNVTGYGGSRTYGDDNSTIAYSGSLSGQKFADDVVTVSGSVDSTVTDHSSAGTHSNVLTASLTGTSADNYTLSVSGTPVTGDLTINKAVLNVSGYRGSRTYGDDNSTITYSGTLSGLKFADDAVIVNGTVDGSVTNRSSAAGYSGVLTSALSGADAGNYVLAPVTGALTINRALLSIAGYGGSRTYGDDNSTIAYTGTLSGKKFADDDVSYTAAVDGSVTDRSNAGTHSNVLIATLSGSSAGNYTLSLAGTPLTGDLTINKALLNLSGYSGSRTYGDSNDTIAYSGSLSGQKFADDVVSYTTSVDGTVTDRSNAGTHTNALTASLTGASAGNYTLSLTGAPVTGDLTINKAVLNLSGYSGSRTYGDNNGTIAYIGSLSGKKFADDVVTVSGNVDSSVTDRSNAGTHSNVLNANLTGTSAGNYVLSAPVTGDLTINKALLSIAGYGGSRTYGDDNSTIAYTGTLSGKKFANDDVSYNSSVDGSVTDHSNAGTQYNVLTATLTGTSVSNYTLSLTNTPVTGDLIINKALLNLSGYSGTRTYGDANSTITYTGVLSGKKFADDDVSYSSTVASSVTDRSNAGTHTNALTASLTGTAADNYTLSVSGTPVTGDLTINKAVLNLSAYSGSRTYGEDNSTITYTGTLTGQKFTDDVVSVSGNVTDSNVTNHSNAASYNGVLQGALSGASAENYTLAAPVTGNLTISQAQLSVTGYGGSRTYGDTNDKITYTGTLNGKKFADDDIAVSNSVSTTITKDTQAGMYANVLTGNLTGSAAGNYTMAPIMGNLTINHPVITNSDYNSAITWSARQSRPDQHLLITTGNMPAYRGDSELVVSQLDSNTIVFNATKVTNGYTQTLAEKPGIRSDQAAPSENAGAVDDQKDKKDNQ